MKNYESGRMGPAILIVITAVVLATFGVILWMRGGTNRTPQTIGVTSPAMETHDTPRGTTFSDGLGTPDATTRYELDDFGAGVARRDVFMRDINGDGEPDRITRTRVENGTDHYFDEYTIELKNGNSYTDITPPDMRTVESADCAVARYQFIFRPTFRIIKIARPWRDTWTTPTMATRTIYRLGDNTLRAGGAEPIKEVCNVADLF